MARGLKKYEQCTPQERLFIDNIVGGKNIIDSYLDAGYYPGRERYESGEKSQGAARVRSVELRYKEHVDAIIRERLNKMVMSKEEALARQTAVGRFDMNDVLKVDALVCPHCEQEIIEEGVARIDVKAMKEYGLAHLIKKITYDRNGNQIIEFRDIDASQDRLLRAHGAYVTQAEESVGGLANLMAKALEMRQNGSQ